MLLLTDDFYISVLKQLLKKNIFNKNSKILIAAAGQADKKRFLELGFKNVTITNLDIRMKADSFKPYKWSFQSLEKINFKDNSFDFCVIHHGLHHSPSPHGGLLELYRVSKYGLLVFEGIDNFLSKLGSLFGFSEKYELAAVNNNDLLFGGFNNTGIPNFVYRWSKSDVVKTISSYEPKAKPEICFFYGIELPFNRLKKMKNKLFYLIALFTYPMIFLMFIFFHKYTGNRFAFFINKPDFSKKLFPWLKLEKNKISADKSFFKDKFK